MRAIVGGQPLKEMGQSEAGEARWVALALVEAEHEVEEIDVIDRVVDAAQQIATDAPHRQHHKTGFF